MEPDTDNLVKEAMTVPLRGMKLLGGEMLFRITAPHFCAGVAVAHDGAIVAAAPILRWAYNRPWAYLRRWAEGKGYKIERGDAK